MWQLRKHQHLPPPQPMGHHPRLQRTEAQPGLFSERECHPDFLCEQEQLVLGVREDELADYKQVGSFSERG